MITALIVIAILLGFYVAWNIGANDVANAVGPSVGSKALTLKQAVIIAAIFEFAGAFFLGGSVSETVESGIVKTTLFNGDQMDYVFGMLAALLATGVWLQAASFFGWPVSTTHAIVGGVMGFGLVLGGVNAIYWGKIGSIVISWGLSPILGGVASYYIFSVIRRRILYHVSPVYAAKRLTPYFVFAVFALLSFIILFGGLKNLSFHLNLFEVLAISTGIGLIIAFISLFLVRKIQVPTEPVRKQDVSVEIGLRKAKKHLYRVRAASMGEANKRVRALLKEIEELTEEIEVPEEVHISEYGAVEKIFIYLQIIIACFMAFAHGSNDVANAIGPLSAIFNVLQGKSIAGGSVPIWLLLLGGVGIVIGLATWGWRVIETVGRKITELTPSRGFAAGFGAAAIIVLASKLGLPISTTHVLVGAVLGVGFARGIGAINLNTIRDVVISWIITVPASAALSVGFFFIFRAIFSN